MAQIQKISKVALAEFMHVSNKIERLDELPTDEQVEAAWFFIHNLQTIETSDLCKLALALTPAAQLRDQLRMDVRVGNHVPEPGGLRVPRELDRICDEVIAGKLSPLETHFAFLHLHPFRDGNGRTSRIWWLRQMLRAGTWRYQPLGFLHEFYYQTLQFMDQVIQQRR